MHVERQGLVPFPADGQGGAGAGTACLPLCSTLRSSTGLDRISEACSKRWGVASEQKVPVVFFLLENSFWLYPRCEAQGNLQSGIWCFKPPVVLLRIQSRTPVFTLGESSWNKVRYYSKSAGLRAATHTAWGELLPKGNGKGKETQTYGQQHRGKCRVISD